MPGSLQNKLHRYEVVPPPSVWEKISGRLDEEFRQSDIEISSKLDGAAIPPPATAWENISSVLHQENLNERPARVIPLVYKRLALAVILAGVFAIGAMYLLTGDNTKAPFDKSDETVVERKKETEPSQSVKPAPSLKRSDSTPSVQLSSSTPVVAKRNGSVNSRRTTYLAQSEPTVSNRMEQSHPELQTVSALQPIAVSAPPIRDARGNIIMDVDLISSPDEPYIIVTSPNGNQTRISNKFLNCLKYINSNFSSSDMDAEGRQCKSRFEEWRRKLLSEATFIPAANNFFDIFELKEMIQDR